MARSAKDMNQWVFAINFKKQQVSNIFRNCAQSSSEEDLQTYETVDDLKKQKPFQSNNLVSKNESLQPELPLRTHNNYLHSKNKNSLSLTETMKVDNENLEADEDDEDNIYHSVSNNFRPIPEKPDETKSVVTKPIDTRNTALIEEINKKTKNIRDSITDEDLVDYDEPREIMNNYIPNIQPNSSFRSLSNTRNEMTTKNVTNEKLPIYDNTAEVPKKPNENTIKKPAKIMAKPVTSPKPKDITSSIFSRRGHNSDFPEGLTHIQKICQQIETSHLFKPKS